MALVVALVLTVRVSAVLFLVAFPTFGLIGIRIVSAIDASRAAKRLDARRAGIGWVFAAALVFFVGGRATALASRAFVIEAFQIPSGAMVPTLLIGDHIFADKRPWSPRRGDVIVFEFPENRRQWFISRVVGLPGERIEVRAGRLTIDGREVPRCQLGLARDQIAHVEWLQDQPHLILLDRDLVMLDQGPWTVPAGEYFVMSDNRHNAHDSRSWFGGRGGSVPASHVKGRALSVWWSWDPRGGVATDRIGVEVHDLVLPAHLALLQPALQACLAAPPQ